MIDRKEFEEQIRLGLAENADKASEQELRASLISLGVMLTGPELRMVFKAIAAYKPEKA